MKLKIKSQNGMEWDIIVLDTDKFGVEDFETTDSRGRKVIVEFG